jgi:hypothetical protein
MSKCKAVLDSQKVTSITIKGKEEAKEASETPKKT